MSEDTAPDIIETLPLDSWHRAQGARMVPFAGYHMPIQYEGIIAEHLWTRESAGLFDVSHMGQLFLSGDGLDGALEALLPADIESLTLGQMRYSLLLNEEGGILDDLMLTRWRDGIYMVVNGATKWDDIGHLHEHLPDAITLNHMDARALLALQGPKAFDALKRLVSGETPLEALVFMTGGRFQIDGVDAHISRSGYTGEDGFEISVDAGDVEAVANALLAQPEVKPIGLGARDSLRLEAGLPLYGHDLNEQIDPVSTDLKFAISKRRRGEGGFPGADKILGYLKHGAPAKRIGLSIEGRQPAREGALVYDGDAQVGTVTSGGFSPSLQAPIAMAIVSVGSAPLGRTLEIDVRGKRLAATVVPMPFVPHRYHRKGA
ncbi:aminomethyltransferase [Sphingomonas vulcanisoli]|uniref:aminomethyltransferase n=1 Tax=Sphingomonas vulcanisoli TaxID=1658060 RepID=A0ABX0TQG6_9SPHN|nr:glycine cleavage system aminomethyltransferase GcvT [Sphingomonas vulcanisoli]NIJ06989.1 aminomethyltransferase [Sphingomonas vulcanisoli]